MSSTQFIIILAVVGVSLLVCALLLKWRVSSVQRSSGIPLGKVIYDDLFETGKILVSNTYPLSGKPDYIMKHQKALIPIEVKTGNHHHPLAHHCMQLVCYCQLVSDEYGIQVPFGMLVYSDTGKQFNIPYDAEMKRRLHTTFYNMEQILQGNHFLLDPTIVYNKHKCSTCSMNSYCDIPKRPS